MQNKGILYLIPTPIGNLKEVSPRILSTIDEVSCIFCEDTRNTQKLLNLLGKNKKTISCHEHNEKIISSKVIELLENGENIAYMSDAGYPAISDPGSILVKECIKNDIKVTPLSGPNAFINALVGSNQDTSHFIFYGFLNSKSSERKKELESLKNYSFTIIFYEAPHRINDSLKDIYEIFGNRNITIARELTKLNEEFIYSTLENLVTNQREYKGELVLVVEGKINKNEPKLDREFIKDKYDELLKSNFSSKDAINILSIIYKINKNSIKKIVY